MSATNFNKVGISVLAKSVEPDAKAYLHLRGHTDAAIRAANFRYVDAENAEYLFPASIRGKRTFGNTTPEPDKETQECYFPKYAIVLPYPDDPTYCVARIKHEIIAGDPPRFLTPTGRGLLPYVPPSISRKDLLDSAKPLFVVESPFKSVVAASRGLVCIGVNGHTGAFEPGTKRGAIRAELHEYLKPGRPVCLLTDADARTNLEVRKSLLWFMDAAVADFDCKPFAVELPDLGDGKSGIDDYFAAGHKLRDFEKLLRHSRGSTAISELRCAFYELTETGLAQRFEAQHGADCRRDPKIKQWYTWTSSGYRSGNVEPEARIIQTAASLAAETAAAKSPQENKVRAKFAKDCGKLNAQNAALTIAGRFPSMHIDAAQFDAESDLLGVRNGVLRLSTGKLLAPSRDLMVTMLAGCAFDSKAGAPGFVEYMRTVTKGDAALLGYLQEVIGAALLGRAIRTAIQIFYGPGGTGKTTLIEIILAMLGQYATATKADLLLRQRQNTNPEAPTPFLKVLRGLRLVVCSELNENVAINDALVKDLTGADTVTARGLHEAPITFKNTAAIWIRGNHAPVISGTDTAIRERVNIVPFGNVIEAGTRDKTLADRIITTELSGVLNWALVGMRRYVARGYEFALPDAVTKATRQVQAASDVIGAWLDDSYQVDPTQTELPWRETQAGVTRNHREWCAQNGHRPLSSKMLWSKLRLRFGFGEDWPLRSDGGKFATGFKAIRDPNMESIKDKFVESMVAANQDIAKLLKEARDEIAALKAERAPTAASDSSDSPGGNVVPITRGNRK
jgi:P4 family phage/plasmid primase-like protien